MDKKLKAKWVKALRSGKFEQWREGALCEESDEDGKKAYCCLGVLRLVVNPKDKGSRANMGTYLSDRQLLSYGLEHEMQEKLAELNDNGKRFPTIAKYIEKHL